MTDQPLPTPGAQPVTQALIAELEQRTARGIATYGRPLETFNGRDALRDALDEALDLSQHLKQAIMERDELRSRVPQSDVEVMRALVGLVQEQFDNDYCNLCDGDWVLHIPGHYCRNEPSEHYRWVRSLLARARELLQEPNE